MRHRHFLKTAAMTAMALAIACSVSLSQMDWQKGEGSDEWIVQSIASSPGGVLYAGTFGGGIYKSPDNGKTWRSANAGLDDLSVFSVVVDNAGVVFAGTFGGGVYRSEDDGNTWAPTPGELSNKEILALAITPEGDLLAGTAYGGLFISPDNGDNWELLGLEGAFARTITTGPGAAIFVGSPMGVFHSPDKGKTWRRANTGLRNVDVWSVATDLNGSVFAATNGGGVFCSSDAGNTWLPLNSGLTCLNSGSIALNEAGDVFAGTTKGVFRLEGSRASWIDVCGELPECTIQSLALGVDGRVILGTSGKGIYRSILPAVSMR